jgi:hypothetical protein
VLVPVRFMGLLVDYEDAMVFFRMKLMFAVAKDDVLAKTFVSAIILPMFKTALCSLVSDGMLQIPTFVEVKDHALVPTHVCVNRATWESPARTTFVLASMQVPAISAPEMAFAAHQTIALVPTGIQDLIAVRQVASALALMILHAFVVAAGSALGQTHVLVLQVLQLDIGQDLLTVLLVIPCILVLHVRSQPVIRSHLALEEVFADQISAVSAVRMV